MKPMLLAIPMLSAAFLRVCGGDDAPAPAAPAATVVAEVAAPTAPPSVDTARYTAEPGVPSVTATVSAPTHGGTIVAAEDRRVELVAHRDGVVTAYPVGRTTPYGERISVTLPGNDRAPHLVSMTWDPTESRYEGRLLEVQPAAGSVELVLNDGGRTYVGRSDTYVIVDAPAPPSAFVVASAAPTPAVYVAPPGPPSVHVVAPSPPSVVIAPPSPPSVRIVAPSPPSPVVVVERPRAPVVVVERPRPPVVVIERPSPPSVVVVGPRPRPGVVFVGSRPRRDRVIVVDRHGRGRGHGGGRGWGHIGGRGHGHGRH